MRVDAEDVGAGRVQVRRLAHGDGEVVAEVAPEGPAADPAEHGVQNKYHRSLFLPCQQKLKEVAT